MDSKFIKGNIVSIIAAVAIFTILLELDFYGVSFGLTVAGAVQFFLVWLLAIPAVEFYGRSAISRKRLFWVSSILAMAITLPGIPLAAEGNFLGLGLIVAGYTFEPIAGIPLYIAVKKYGLSSHLFFWGAVVYTVGLPLYLFNLPYVALLGDLVKTVGLLWLVAIGAKGLKEGSLPLAKEGVKVPK